MSFIFEKLAPLNIWLKRCLNHVLVNSSPKTSLRSAKNVVFFLFCILVDRPMGGGAKALPWLRYSHRMSENYLLRFLIFLLPKVYFVQVFIQHTVTNNVIKLHSRRHDVPLNRHTFCAKPHYCIA